MGPEVKAELRARVNARNEAISKLASGDPRPPLFPRWPKPNQRLTVQRACRRAGIEFVTTNDMRATYATLMAIEGVPQHVLAKLMGHSSTKMLDKVYVRVGHGAYLDEAAATLPRLYGERGDKPQDGDT